MFSALRGGGEQELCKLSRPANLWKGQRSIRLSQCAEFTQMNKIEKTFASVHRNSSASLPPPLQERAPT